MRTFAIGNSLTVDTMPSYYMGEYVDASNYALYHFCHLHSSYSLKAHFVGETDIEANLNQHCIVYGNTSYGLGAGAPGLDFLMLQSDSYDGAHLAEDIDYASRFIDLARANNPHVKVIIHPGWETYATPTAYLDPLSDELNTPFIASRAYIDAWIAALLVRYPTTEFRCTNTHKMFHQLYLDYQAQTSPFYAAGHTWDEFFFRDALHATYSAGRYVAHNAMRLSMDNWFSGYTNLAGSMEFSSLDATKRSYLRGIVRNNLSFTPKTNPVLRLRMNSTDMSLNAVVSDDAGNGYSGKLNASTLTSVTRTVSPPITSTVVNSPAIQWPTVRAANTIIQEASTISPLLEMEFGDAFTIMGWFYLRTNAASTENIFGKTFGSGASGTGLYLQFMPATHRLDFYTIGPSTYGYSKATITSYENAWHHYAITMTAAGVATLYIDGVNANWTTTNAHTVMRRVGRGVKYTLGNLNTTDNTQVFTGSIDDFRIYGSAKTQGEIQSIMNASDATSTAIKTVLALS